MSVITRRMLGAAALALPAVARAQGSEAGGWPSRPVRVVVPFPPGGSNDAVARPLAEHLQAKLGHPFVVENRPGAGSTIGSAEVARAPADGYTLMVTSSSFPTSAVLQKTPWDAEGSFDAVAVLARAPFFVMTNPNFPARDIPSLVALAKARPNSIDYGTSGAGGINHFISEYFCLQAGVQMSHIPYRGTAPAVTDLVAGNINLMITTVASANAATSRRVREPNAATTIGPRNSNATVVPSGRCASAS